jgi:hypothetical protein
VVQTHPSVTKLQVGDRVAGLVWGGELSFIYEPPSGLADAITGEVKGLGAYSYALAVQ